MKTLKFGFLCCLLIILNGCEKFLDEKPSNSYASPRSLKDVRAILDVENSINNVYPSLLQIPADEFQINYQGLSNIPVWYKDGYLWEDNGLESGSYLSPYLAVSYANVVLESLERIKDKNTYLSDQLKGEALFIRGWMFFNLAQVYCVPYTINHSQDNLGLVLRLDSDSEISIGRSTLEETYRRIFEDLNTALELLPEKAEYITRPSKQACLAALARVYLTIDDYENAERMVDLLLNKNQNLLDYNIVNRDALYPFSLDINSELLYYARCGSTGHFVANDETYIDPELYSMYDENDLRTELYYEKGANGMKFRGFYHGNLADYSAVLAMDEIYLIKAECLARRGEMVEGLRYLNVLREKRFEKGSFQPLVVSDKDVLLKIVLEERRRQLVCRGIRWLDLRRLNRDPRFAKTLERRIYDGEKEIIYTLEPNDLRYTHLIPVDAMDVGDYMQNSR